MLEKTNRVNLLFDFYGPILKDRQRQFLEMYYREDLTLSEIAEVMEVTRQAVYDQVKRTEIVLEQYEDKLQLLSRYQERQSRINRLLDLLDSDPPEWDSENIRTLVKELAELEWSEEA
ncbi:putative DNA-binding protein [Ammoniphilus sp. CFH 90114]|uniref:putative DNA-binding protein n=1 Tax=Ammoniphilus sp. CFH 90114 TaxID=2493665 RepID=UPI00100EAC52|nr:putative DNA-binding protein [Ammoniphilus sp. CFH 90114]RXT15085.1 putative DNA-binding protein [Ammoniphilus sp. CFH 90114]